MAYRQLEEKIKNPIETNPIPDPEKPIGRTLELESIKKVFSLVTTQKNPLHIWIWGPQGSGKTLIATFAAREIAKTNQVLIAHSNCWSSNSLYALVNDVIDQFGVLRAELQDTRFKIDKIKKHLKDKKCIFIIDEIDRLEMKERNAVLYQFQDMQNFWIVAISHQEPMKLGIEPRVWSRLSPILARFTPYSNTEVIDILTHHLKTVDSEVKPTSQQLREIAEQCNGDARRAKKLLEQRIILGLSDLTSFSTRNERRKKNG